LEEVLPRQSKLSRPDPFDPALEHVVAANVDQIIVVVSSRNPPFDREIIDRYLVGSENLGLTAIICVNKMDLVPRLPLADEMKVYSRMGYPVLLTSAIDRSGLEELVASLKGKTSVLVGYSGVGKSSLLNAIEPGLHLGAKEVSARSGFGRHATVSVRLLSLSFGGYVVDTPGIREFGLWRVRPWELPRLFRDFQALARDCRYPACFHVNEPDCAVRQALAEGTLDAVRYKNYLRILDSLTGKRKR
jgi:ribosome biogenesis GTPase